MTDKALDSLPKIIFLQINTYRLKLKYLVASSNFISQLIVKSINHTQSISQLATELFSHHEPHIWSARHSAIQLTTQSYKQKKSHTWRHKQREYYCGMAIWQKKPNTMLVVKCFGMRSKFLC